jgi:hypothetical protein
VDLLVHAIEEAEPEAIFGSLNVGSVGFRVQVGGELWIVRVEEPRPSGPAPAPEMGEGVGNEE